MDNTKKITIDLAVHRLYYKLKHMYKIKRDKEIRISYYDMKKVAIEEPGLKGYADILFFMFAKDNPLYKVPLHESFNEWYIAICADKTIWEKGEFLGTWDDTSKLDSIITYLLTTHLQTRKDFGYIGKNMESILTI